MSRAATSPTIQTPTMVDDLSTLLPDWSIHLRARNIAPSTIDSYMRVGANLLAYLRDAGMPTSVAALGREHIEAFPADMGDRLSPATVAKHYRSLQQLFRWLVEDGEITGSPMARMRPPQVPEQPVDVFTDDELSRLLKAAQGQLFDARRDTALLRMLFDTGMRSAELCGSRSPTSTPTSVSRTSWARDGEAAPSHMARRRLTRSGDTSGHARATRKQPVPDCGSDDRDPDRLRATANS